MLTYLIPYEIIKNNNPNKVLFVKYPTIFKLPSFLNINGKSFAIVKFTIGKFMRKNKTDNNIGICKLL